MQSKFDHHTLSRVTAKLLEDPCKLLYVINGEIVDTLRHNCICFGPNANEELNNNKNFIDWVNTNIKHTEWTSTHLWVSYYGVFDLNSTPETCIRITSKSTYKPRDGDILCFIGSLHEWRQYTKRFIQKRDGQYLNVFVYCILLGECLPHFPATEQTTWTTKNFHFESPQYWKMYRSINNNHEYLSNTRPKAGTIYTYYSPKKNKRRLKNKQIELSCGIECKCKKLRNNLNVLAHHALVHCKTPRKCCVVGCTTNFDAHKIKLKEQRRHHYRKVHKYDKNESTYVAKETDILLEAWLAHAKVCIITQKPMIGTVSKCITNEEIYEHFRVQIELLENTTVAFAILYTLGLTENKISISVLHSTIQDANIVATMDEVMHTCENLKRTGVISLTKIAHNCRITLENLYSIVQNHHLYIDARQTWLINNIIDTFEDTLFDIQDEPLDANVKTILQQNDLLVTNNMRLLIKFDALIKLSYKKQEVQSIVFYMFKTIQRRYATQIKQTGGAIKDKFLLKYPLPSVGMDTIFDLITTVPIGLFGDHQIALLAPFGNCTTPMDKALNLIQNAGEVDVLVTNDILKKFKQLKNYITTNLSGISMVGTCLDYQGMWRYWNQYKNPYIINPEALTNKGRKSNTTHVPTLYAKYWRIPQEKFLDVVDSLNTKESNVLMAVYKNTEHKSPILKHEIKSTPDDIIRVLLGMGLCKLVDNTLYPNTLGLYTQNRFNELQKRLVMIYLPPEQHRKLLTLVDTPVDVVVNIRYTPGFNYYEHFKKYDSPHRKSVTMDRIYLNRPRSLLELIQDASLDYRFNVSSFFTFVVACGYKNGSLCVKLKQNNNQDPSVAISTQLRRNNSKIDDFILSQVPTNIIFYYKVLAPEGISWIINNIESPISRQFLSNLTIIRTDVDCCTIKSECGAIVQVKREQIPTKLICDGCQDPNHDHIKILPCPCPLIQISSNVKFKDNYLATRNTILKDEVIFTDHRLYIHTKCNTISNNSIIKVCDVIRRKDTVANDIYVKVCLLKRDNKKYNAKVEYDDNTATVKSIEEIPEGVHIVIPLRLCLDCAAGDFDYYDGICDLCFKYSGCAQEWTFTQ